ncbi:MAG: adenylate/guanylate cyclase domain-containing protein [Hyphomicrobiales bacterium]|nr:adenylate/guanylate cyclase domain-containing protein [Hyphomicrobiales bacterium]
MQLSSTLAWLIDEAGASPDADLFLAELGARLIDDGLPLAGGALTLAAPHPIIARRTWLWRAETRTVIEALGFATAGLSDVGPAGPPGKAGRAWLTGLGGGPVHEDLVGPGPDGPALAWIGQRPLTTAEIDQLRLAARFASAPLAALMARATLTAALEAYLGRRSAERVMAGPLRRGVGETIRAALLCADLRGFTSLSETAPPAQVIAALDAWFDRIAGSVHAFGGEVLKFLGDGMLAIFPVAGGSPGAACDAALNAVSAARAGMAHLDEVRRRQGLPPLPFGAAVHLGDVLWGNIGAADRLDFTAIGPAVNLVSRLEGLCRPLDKGILVSGAAAAETRAQLTPLGLHTLRGIASPCAVFTIPESVEPLTAPVRTIN